MQTIEEIKTCISATQNELNQKYKHISLRTYPFEDEVVDVLPCKGLYYSEDYWVENLFFITKKGYYFTNSDILKDSYWSFDDHQPYAEFLIGIAKIAKVVKFNEDINPLLHLIRTIVSYGKISASVYIRGPHAGMKHYSYCHFGYSWIGNQHRNN